MNLPGPGPSPSGLALVIGGQGGIGAALADALLRQGGYAQVWALGRSSRPAVDLQQETSLAGLARAVGASGLPLRLVINAAGFLHGRGWAPEKSWRELEPEHLAHAFAVNAIGPALLMKHCLPLLPRLERSVLACLSARVGSIGDNRLGGWYGYRASKAALNQLVHTSAIELRRRQPGAICVALHPGTVDTGLSAPFARSGLQVQAPEQAAQALLAVIDGLQPEHSGGFYDHHGLPVPW